MKKSSRTQKGGANLSRCLLIVLIASTSLFVHADKNNDGTQKFTVLHTNDNHGHFWKNKYGELGMAARATLINQIRAEVKAGGGSLLLLSGGDINTGVPESDLQDAEPDFIGMNMMGYDAMAVGNHEFDNPFSVLKLQQQLAEFPFLAANIYKEGKRLFKPYEIFNRSGLKIAVVGLTTEDTVSIANPEFVKGIDFRDPKSEMKQIIAELKSTIKPDVIIASTHMGHYANGNNGSNAPGDVALARYLDFGDLDMIVGGHSQKPACMDAANSLNEKYKPTQACTPDKQNGTLIVQAHEWGKYLGRADYEMNDGELELVNYQLIPVNLKQKVKLLGKNKRVFLEDEIKPDPALYEALLPYQKKGQTSLDIIVGKTNGEFIGERNVVRNQQTNLGRLIATAQMKQAKADFGIMNSGGIRGSISPGDISYRDILLVQPFSNMISVVEMSGAEVLKYLTVVANIKPGSGGYAQYANLSMSVKNGQVSQVKIAQDNLQLHRNYRFSVPSFNASGGNNYPNITTHPGYSNTGYVDADALKNFIEENTPLDIKRYQPSDHITYQ